MRFDLQATVDILVDRNCDNRYVKAACLFEFYVALFFPKYLVGIKPIQNTRELRDARMIVAMALLENIDRSSRKARTETTDKPQSVLRDREYRLAYRKIFVPAGGWKAARNKVRDADFQKKLDDRIRQAAVVSSVVDFAHRYSSLSGKTKRLSSTMARSMILGVPDYKYSMSSKTLQNRWAKYSASALFLYLLSFPGTKLSIPPISSPRFAKQLINIAADASFFETFFSTYAALSQKLSKFRRFPPIQISPNSALTLTTPPFSGELRDKISRYSNSPGRASRTKK